MGIGFICLLRYLTCNENGFFNQADRQRIHSDITIIVKITTGMKIGNHGVSYNA